jgi:tricorn protease
MYCLHPCLQHDTVVFTAAQTLWSVPLAGGRPQRLSERLPGLSWPHFSPDGQQIAFVWRGDVYLMQADGSGLRRLTYLQSPMTLLGWPKTNALTIVTSAREPFRQGRAYSVSIDCADLKALPYGHCEMVAFGPSQPDSDLPAIALQRHGYGYASWKRYQGGTAGELWVDARGDGDFQRLFSDIRHNILCPMWVQNRLYFLSDFKGRGQLHSCTPGGQDLQTHEGPHTAYLRQSTTDGQGVIAVAAGHLWHFCPTTQKWTDIPIQGPAVPAQRGLRTPKDPKKFLTSYDVSPKGSRLAITTRGRLFSLTPSKGPAVQLGARDGARYRWTTWLHDHTLVAVGDEGGREFWAIYPQGTLQPTSTQEVRLDLPDTIDHGRVTSLQPSPSKPVIAFTNHRNELFWLNVETKKLGMVDLSPRGSFEGYDWSPCGQFLAYSKASKLHGHSLWIYDLQTRSQTCVQDDTFENTHPAFDPQGKSLYFLSSRTFDAQWDSQRVTLSCGPGEQPFVMLLSKETQSPFVTPLLEGLDADEKNQADEKTDAPPSTNARNGLGSTGQADETTAATTDERVSLDDQGPSGADGPLPPAPQGNDGEGTKEVSPDKKTPQPTIIDFDGIESRVLAFPLPARSYSSLVATQGGVLYTVSEDKMASLYGYRFENLKEEMLVSALDSWTINLDRTWMAYSHRNQLRTLLAGSKAEDQPDSPGFQKGGLLDWSRINLTVDNHREWVQMFDEAWRLQKDMFWTEAMGEVDWQSVYDRYRPLVDRVQDKAELYDVIAEMQGELGTSHAYIYPSSEEKAPKPLATLGAELIYDGAVGAYRITHMLTHDAWQHIPLCRPGLNIQVGDLVWAVGGQPLSPTMRPEELIAGQEGKAVPIVVSKPDASDRRTVVVFPAPGHQDRLWRYRQWCETARAYVDQHSQGRVGIVHLLDMMEEGYGEFRRGFLRDYDKEGLIIDARFNGGGNCSPQIIDFLRRERLGYDQSRHQGLFPYPNYGPRGPMVALINESTGSDGDIFAHAFRALDLGPLIGKRTWGGVVGIWPRYSLIDGTMTTQPEYSFWFHDAGWTVENKGVDPTIEVDITPQDAQMGKDPQLDRALSELALLIEQDQSRQNALQTRPPLPVLAEPKA